MADRYELPIRVYYPDGARLEAYTSAHGANAFFDSVEAAVLGTPPKP